MNTRDSILKSLQQGFDYIQGINKSEARSSKPTAATIKENVNIFLVNEDDEEEEEE